MNITISVSWLVVLIIFVLLVLMIIRSVIVISYARGKSTGILNNGGVEYLTCCRSAYHNIKRRRGW